ncbi:MAG: amino acid adenylation domain-containing protein, partial [Acidobacteriota bacterium]
MSKPGGGQNGTVLDGNTLHGLLAAQAERSPDAVALVDGEVRLTYGELSDRIRRLAARLQSLGVGPEEPVAVCLERSADLVVALAAVLEAGGAYLPLDPGYPPQRLAFMLEDARARLVLTRPALADLVDRPGTEPVFLGELLESTEVGAAPRRAVHLPGSLAYLIYTSGSTGRPKGVAITHANAVSMLRWASRIYSDDELSGVLAATSVCFDLSIYELFLPLARGGAVILARDALALPVLPARDEVTLINTVPSAMTELAASAEIPTSVVTVNLAGEPLKRALVDRIHGAGVRRVYNLYGPSEDTTYSTWVRVPRGRPDEPTIGIAVDGTRCHVLDPSGAEVRDGDEGELYLAGDGVSRGYLGRPAATAERYLPDPFSEAPGARLYRTGDRVRPRVDGELDFLGRLDHQVKLRGFRIELGEIESALSGHGEVRMAVATVRDDSGDDGSPDPRLVAYVETDRADLGPEELRDHVARTLPEHMVPRVFVVLDRMPLTPNGKVDRKALPAPTSSALSGRSPYVAPRTEAERRVASWMGELLGADEMGAEDDFFALGGHSLLAGRLAARVRSELGVAMGPRQLFDTPTVAALAAWIEGEPVAGSASALTPLEPGAEPPLTAAQSGLWFLMRLDESSALYNVPVAMELRGDLEIPRLRRALSTLTSRHGVLRSRFTGVDGRPRLRIDDGPGFTLDVRDWRGDARDWRGGARDLNRQRALRLLETEARRPFDLERGPLLRVTVLRLEDDVHLLMVNQHHLVTDGVSLQILFRELAASYGGETLPPLTVQFPDVAAWQRRRLTAGELGGQLDYWRTALAGLDEGAMELPVDRPRPTRPRHAGDRLQFELGADLVAELEALGRRHGATPFMTLLGLFQAWLARLTGNTDVAVGAPVADRARPETEPLLGFFVNMVVVRTGLGGNPTLAEILGRVRSAVLGAFENQEVPFERVVDALRPDRQLGRHPLVDVVFQMRDDYFGPEVFPGTAASRIDVHSGTSKYDLDVAAIRDPGLGGGLRVEVEFSTELFDRGTVERLMASYKALLASASAAPDVRLSGLDLVPSDDLALRYSRSGAPAGPVHDGGLHRRFAQIVAEHGDDPALSFADGELTYRQLDLRAAGLARRLRRLGVGFGTPVAVCLERSASFVTSILAVIQAGGAYVPLDPAYPRERLALMLEDAGAPVVITDGALAELLPIAELGLRVVIPSAVGGDDEPLDPPPAPIGAGDLPAVILFTSGSTGRPKGVPLPQRGLLRLVVDCGYFEIRPDDRLSQVSNVSFDAASFEIWGALLHGAELVGVAADDLASASALRRRFDEGGVTVAFLTTALMQQFAREDPGVYRGLRGVFFGGERCDPDAVGRALTGGPRGLFHAYGPTEDSTYATVARVEAVPDDASSVPVGTPITATDLWIVDRWGRPLPTGAVGELWIGGGGLAFGYHRRPGLTAGVFVPHPASDEPGARAYRTGDLARWLPGGEIDIIGRIDHQVKVRGFPVELGEIESALGQHPGVAAQAVSLQGDGRGGKRLVAYVVPEADPEADGAPSPGELRSFLGASLPDYLVPSAYQFLDRLPLTPNGKVDRRALPSFDFRRAGLDSDGVAPRNPTEGALADLWCEILGMEELSVEASFFELGGHSLLGSQLLARVRDRFGVELPLRALFEAPTVEAMARRIEGEAPADLGPELKPRSAEAPLELSPGQRRMWFLQRLDPESPLYNIPLATEMEGALDLETLGRALDEVVRRHRVLRTRYLERDGEPVAVLDPPVAVPLPVEDLSHLGEGAARRRLGDLVRRGAHTPFDLETGPVFRARLARLGAERHVLILDVHHIASDGWSHTVLGREIGALYGAFRRGLPSPLAEPPLQYADVAAWQNAVLAGDATAASVEVWRRRLEGLGAVELPLDHPRPPVESHRGELAVVTLPAELGEALRGLAAGGD